MSEMTLFKSTPCVVCGKVTELELPTAKLEAWRGGEFIQVVFPEMTNQEREVLISGVCSDDCWDKLWCVCAQLGREECPVHG